MAEKKEIVHIPSSELEIMMAIWEAKGPVLRTYIDEKLAEKKWVPDLPKKVFLNVKKLKTEKTTFTPRLFPKKNILNLKATAFLESFADAR